MDTILEANVVAITIDSVSYTAQLESYANPLGAEPGEAVVFLADLHAEDVAVTTLQGKTAVLTIDGVTVLDGDVFRVIKQLQDRSIRVVIKDKRWRINATYVGYDKLETLDGDGLPTTTNGLKVLGADVIFNRDGKPNKDIDTGIYLAPPIAPDFVYNRADVAEMPDCGVDDREYWTYGDIIDWLWSNYVTPQTGIAKPTIHSTGGLNRKAGQIDVAYTPVAEAISMVLSQTNASWWLHPDGTAYIVTKDNPITSLALNFGNPDNPAADCSGYDLTHPSQFTLEHSIEESVAQVDVVGGNQIRQIKPVQTDFIAAPAGGGRSIVLSPGFLDGKSLSGYLPWSNCETSYESSTFTQHTRRKKYTFDHSKYQAHRAGRNIRQRDLAKPMLGNLLYGRDKYGRYVAWDKECALQQASVQETLYAQYPSGVEFDLNRFDLYLRHRKKPDIPRADDIVLDPDTYSALRPKQLAVPVVTEFRAHVNSSGTLAYLPVAVRRAALRQDIIHQTTEQVDLPAAMVGEFLTSDEMWHMLSFFPPSGWTYLFPTIFDEALDPTDYVFRSPAETVVDGIAPLNEVKAVIDAEIAQPVITVRGAFPSWRTLWPGTKLTAGTRGTDWGLTGNEIVASITFSGETQELQFQASNRIGAGIEELAKTFVDTRANRRRRA